MKKLTLALSTLLLTSTLVYAQSSTIDLLIEGEITAPPCNLDAIPNIKLGETSSRDLRSVLSKGATSLSQISFSNCNVSIGGGIPAESVDFIIEDGQANEKNNQYWADLRGNRQNIGIELKIDGKTVPPNNAGNAISKKIDGKNIKYDVEAAIIRTGDGPIEAGTVGTTINFIAHFK